MLRERQTIRALNGAAFGAVNSRESMVVREDTSITKFGERTAANMDVALEEAFAGVLHGGDHESRKYVARKLIQSAGKGNLTLEGLRAVARDAFEQLSARRAARPLRQAISLADPQIWLKAPAGRPQRPSQQKHRTSKHRWLPL